jgi:hypothetical protein
VDVDVSVVYDDGSSPIDVCAMFREVDGGPVTDLRTLDIESETYRWDFPAVVAVRSLYQTHAGYTRLAVSGGEPLRRSDAYAMWRQAAEAKGVDR